MIAEAFLFSVFLLHTVAVDVKEKKKNSNLEL